MYRAALPERRKAVAGMLSSLALTSFLTGVTEPIEFSFMFLAPALYLLHAVLTGLSMVIMSLLGVKLGFGFSAGLFDYVLGFGISTRPLLLIPVGLVYFGVYYLSFSWCIRRFDLKTPGREPGELVAAKPVTAQGRGGEFLQALGGAGNLRTVNACMTRLRLTVADPDKIDEARLKQLGSKGMLRVGGDSVQVVLGPIADQVAGEIRNAMHGQPQQSAGGADWIAALGGAANIEELQQRSSRLILRIRHADSVDEAALRKLGARAITRSEGGRLHVLVDEPTAEAVAAAA
jgi:PTS system N-acetylglucosamine-specific IIC component